MIVTLGLDDGGPRRGRRAPFGRFNAASLIADGRLAIALVANGASDFDGVEVVRGAVVDTKH